MSRITIGCKSDDVAVRVDSIGSRGNERRAEARKEKMKIDGTAGRAIPNERVIPASCRRSSAPAHLKIAGNAKGLGNVKTCRI